MIFSLYEVNTPMKPQLPDLAIVHPLLDESLENPICTEVASELCDQWVWAAQKREEPSREKAFNSPLKHLPRSVICLITCYGHSSDLYPAI